MGGGALDVLVVVVSIIALAQVVWLAIIGYLARRGDSLAQGFQLELQRLSKDLSEVRERLAKLEGRMGYHHVHGSSKE